MQDLQTSETSNVPCNCSLLKYKDGSVIFTLAFLVGQVKCLRKELRALREARFSKGGAKKRLMKSVELIVFSNSSYSAETSPRKSHQASLIDITSVNNLDRDDHLIQVLFPVQR